MSQTKTSQNGINNSGLQKKVQAGSPVAGCQFGIQADKVAPTSQGASIEQIQELVARGALFVVNHSGGKDSQAMLIRIRQLVPASQILVVHADLPGVEWAGTQEHARRYCQDLPFITAVAVKTFFQMVDSRKNWPSPSNRQCTSDLKRGPIEREIRRYIKRTGHSGLVVNCMGLRAQESSSRAQATVFELNEKNSVAGREWYDWLPIHDWSKDKVLLEIKKAGQELHPAYGLGMSRLSCAFCIMSSKADLRIAAQHNPDLFQRILAKEQEIGKTMFAVKGKPVALDQYMKGVA